MGVGGGGGVTVLWTTRFQKYEVPDCGAKPTNNHFSTALLSVLHGRLEETGGAFPGFLLPSEEGEGGRRKRRRGRCEPEVLGAGQGGGR